MNLQAHCDYRAAGRARGFVRSGTQELDETYDIAPIGLCTLDRDLRFERVNRCLAEMIGVDAASLIGRSVREALPAFAAAIDAGVAPVFRGETVRGHEITGATPARPGARREWCCAWAPRLGAAGAVTGIVAAIEDVTARRASDVALGETDRAARRGALLLDQLIETAPDPIWCKDADGRWTLINSAASAVLGRSRDELLGLSDRDVFDTATAGVIEAQEATIRATRAPVRLEELIPHQTMGETRTFLSVKSPLFDETGAVAGVLGIAHDITERKRAEMKLAASEEEFRMLGEHLPCLCWIARGDGDIYWYNRGWYDYTGTTPAEMANEGWRTVHHPMLLEDVAARWRGSIVTGERFEMTFPLRGADGQFRPFLTRVHPVRDADGRVTRWFGTNTDVSEATALADELHRSNATLAASEARLQAVVATAPVGIVLADATGAIYGGNAAAEAIFGHPVFQSRNVHDYDMWVAFHDDGRRVVSHEYPLARALAGENRPELEVEYQRGDGRRAWMRIVGAAVRDEDRAIIGAVVAIVDIDAERRARATLERDAAELERLVAARTAERDSAWNVSRDLIAVVDQTGVFRAVNPAWTTMLGYAAQELIGHDYREFVAWKEELETKLAQVDVFRDTTPIENVFCARDGTHRTISWVIAGEGDMLFATGRDVTQERARDAQLAAAREELNQLQKVETLGQLTGGVAHDFNNLLTPIVGSLDLIGRRDGLSPRDKRLIDGALQSAERARVLVQRLLAFARRQRLDAGPVDLGQLLNGLRELIERSIGPRIAVQIAVPAGLAPAEVDANQLELAILNLALNARDAMPDGGTLRLSARVARIGAPNTLAAGRYVVITVSDTGTGMDAETARRAIEPFFSTKGVGKGTGLGLSMVHGLAAQSGGRLTIDSAPGKGTAIVLWLPVATTAIAAAVDDAAPHADHSARAVDVLLVDDEPTVRATVAAMLGEAGHHVREAGSAEDALAAVRGGYVPELLVTDYLMPDQTGAGLAQALKQRLPELPVLLITGYARADDPALAGLHALAKPFTPAELARAVENALA